MGSISFAALGNVFRIPELRKKLIFTFAMLAIYRLGSFITVPGIPADKISGALDGSIFDFLNLWTGGGLGQAAIFGLGIMPFITASIIFQLMVVVSPALAALQKEGEMGYIKINRMTRYLAVALSAMQAFGFFLVLRTQDAGDGSGPLLPPDFKLLSFSGSARMMLFVVSIVAGTTLLMWMGELITQRGIGNGMSLLIFASILSGVTGGIQTWYGMSIFIRLAVPVLLLLVIAAVVAVQEGQRRIPVQYAKRMVGRRMTQGGSTYLPLRVNMAGVIPLIFASAMMAFPTLIGSSIPNAGVQSFIASYLGPNTWVGVTVTALLVMMFTFFYTMVQFNPVDQADNLKKYGGFIPGVRPGAPTAQYLQRLLVRLTFFGALFLAVLVILPVIFINVFGIAQSVSGAFGGTTILIVVGVALDSMRQMESQLVMRNYEGFLK